MREGEIGVARLYSDRYSQLRGALRLTGDFSRTIGSDGPIPNILATGTCLITCVIGKYR